MDDVINKYRCGRCDLGWTAMASAPLPDECRECGQDLCLPYETRRIRRATYTWRCWTCSARWEGDLHDCACGTPQDRIDLLSVRFECEDARSLALDETFSAPPSSRSG